MTDTELQNALQHQHRVHRMGRWGPWDENQPPGRIRSSVSVGRVERDDKGRYLYLPSETRGSNPIFITDTNRDEFELSASVLAP
ncbi:MAG: hypothetical protein OXG35_12740 [Acidobacteria bacterium]|nr:hypothetical protein [Acidobacteriota bacterium]